MNTTIGVSPKALYPTLLLAGLGLLFIILGVILKEDQLKTIGYSVLAAAVPAFGAAYIARPGETIRTVDPARSTPSDDGVGPDGEVGQGELDLLFRLLVLVAIVFVIVVLVRAIA